LQDNIYDYASLTPPNGLEVIIKAEDGMMEQVIARLDAEHKLATVIGAEQSPNVIALFLWHAERGVVCKHEILVVIARRIEEMLDPAGIPDVLSAVFYACPEGTEFFWNILNSKKVERNIVNSGQVLTLVSEMWRLDFVDPAQVGRFLE